MKTKDLVMAAILMAIGTVLHTVVPGIIGDIKPDFLLAMMFVAILTQPNLKNTVAIGLASGLLAAMTTHFPGGQIPSVIDKIVSALAFLALLKVVSANGKYPNLISAGVLFFLGTVISGAVFLGSALMLAGLPAPFMVLFTGIVLTTAVANIVFGNIVYKVYLTHARALVFK